MFEKYSKYPLPLVPSLTFNIRYERDLDIDSG